MRVVFSYIWHVYLTDIKRLDCKQSPLKGQNVFERQLKVGVDGIWFWDVVVDNLFIVWINYTSKVKQGAITDLYIIPIKDLI